MPITSDRKASPPVPAPVVLADPVLSAAQWSAGMPAELRQAARGNDPAAFATAWRVHVLPRGTATTKLPGGLWLWSWRETSAEELLGRLMRKVFPQHDSTRAGKTRSAMKTGHRPSGDLAALVSHLAHELKPWSPLEFLAAGEVLLAFGKNLDVADLWTLWSRAAGEARRKPAQTAEETPEQFLLRAGEVPLLAGLLLEPLRDAELLRQLGRRTLASELIARTDSDGTPHAELLPRLPLWLAPLIRATLWAERFGENLWSDDERQRLALVLERSIPLCRPNGRLAMSNGCAIPALPLFEVAAKVLSLTGPAEKLLKSLKAAPASAAIRKRPGGVETMPSNQSDWARFAMLRSDWSSHADSLAISHHQPQPLLDVAALGKPVLHGTWGWELQIADAVIEPAEEWGCSCWFSDPDADYLELQMRGPGALRVERQILLSRKDHFLLLADCVRGAQSILKDAPESLDDKLIHLRSRLPLAAGVAAEADVPTREIRLKTGKQTVRVFPLALPDDRVLSTPHRCEIDGDDLVLHQIGQGNGLYAPLIFDWHPARTRRPALWRNLTVTEAGQVLTRDLAAGHRLQLGTHQLLTYRSLSPRNAARAVLGLHSWYESVIARFNRKGEVEPIVKVEG